MVVTDETTELWREGEFTHVWMLTTLLLMRFNGYMYISDNCLAASTELFENAVPNRSFLMGLGLCDFLPFSVKQFLPIKT